MKLMIVEISEVFGVKRQLGSDCRSVCTCLLVRSGNAVIIFTLDLLILLILYSSITLHYPPSPVQNSGTSSLVLISSHNMAMLPPTPIRKKRNFRGLQLAVGENGPAPPKDAEPVPIRQAPAPLLPAATAPVERKKRPPPMVIKAPKIPTTSGAVSAVEQDGNMLTVANGAHTAPVNGSPNLRRNTYHAALSSTLANLDMNTEIKFELKDQDLKDLHELGQGNGGSVKKVEHVPTKTIMAKKASTLTLS